MQTSNDPELNAHLAKMAARAECIDRIATAIWNEFVDNDLAGASIGCAGYATCPKDGYLASYAGQEHCVRFAEFTESDVRNYVADHIDSVGLSDWYGIWEHAGTVFLDVSRHFTDRAECVAFAESNDQIAFYDCAEQTSFDVRYA